MLKVSFHSRAFSNSQVIVEWLYFRKLRIIILNLRPWHGPFRLKVGTLIHSEVLGLFPGMYIHAVKPMLLLLFLLLFLLAAGYANL